MRKLKRNSKIEFVKYGVLVLIRVLTIGYALLNETLNSSGPNNLYNANDQNGLSPAFRIA